MTHVYNFSVGLLATTQNGLSSWKLLLLLCDTTSTISVSACEQPELETVDVGIAVSHIHNFQRGHASSHPQRSVELEAAAVAIVVRHNVFNSSVDVDVGIAVCHIYIISAWACEQPPTTVCGAGSC